MKRLWRELRYWNSSRGYLRLLAVGILFVGVSLVLRAALGAETVAERLVTAAVGLLATLSAWAVLKQPRSRRTEDDGAMLHVAEEGAWREARRLGRYAHPSGVVHGCSRAQLRMLVDAHVPDLAGRVVLTIDPAEAAGEVRWSTHVQGGRTERFPHLHGSIPLSAISDAESLARALGAARALPHFRYHPDPLATGAIEASDTPCVCCGIRQGFI